MKRILINLSITLCTIIIVLLMAEVSVRYLAKEKCPRQNYDTLFSQKFYQFAKEPATLLYELVPGAQGILHAEKVRINSFGMRGRETTLEKTEETFRIAVLGDSATFGYRVPEEQNWPSILEKMLNEGKSMQASGKRAEVLNFAVAGYTMNQHIAQLRHKVPKFDPDLIIVGHHLNDIYGEGTVILTPPPLIQFFGKHSTLFSCFNKEGTAGISRLFVTDHYLNIPYEHIYFEENFTWRDYQHKLKRLSEAAPKHSNADMMVVLLPVWDNLDETYKFKDIHVKLSETMREAGLNVLDLAPNTGIKYDDAITYRSHPTDFDHPNERGHTLIAEAIAKKLETENLLP